jgi:hypothetical protein
MQGVMLLIPIYSLHCNYFIQIERIIVGAYEQRNVLSSPNGSVTLMSTRIG